MKGVFLVCGFLTILHIIGAIIHEYFAEGHNHLHNLDLVCDNTNFDGHGYDISQDLGETTETILLQIRLESSDDDMIYPSLMWHFYYGIRHFDVLFFKGLANL